jgi:hypothetical protein
MVVSLHSCRLLEPIAPAKLQAIAFFISRPLPGCLWPQTRCNYSVAVAL